MTFTERIEGGIGTTREKGGQGRGRNYRVAAEQEREIRHSLGASSPGCSGGRVGKRRTQSLQLRLWNLNSTSNYPVVPCWLSCQIYDNQREAETSANVNKHWKIRAKGNDIITNVISTNQHFASNFSTQKFKFLRHSCKFSFVFPPHRQSTLKELACRLDVTRIRWQS